MTMLVILLPMRPLSADAATADAPPEGWSYAFSADGIGVTRNGQAPTDQLPRADTVVAVVPPGMVSWQRPVMPKSPAGRLRAALGGLLEEQLLDEDDQLHLALQPKPAAGQPAWVAVIARGWLTSHLGTLAAAGVHVDRVVPEMPPAPSGSGAPLVHFYRAEGGADTPCWLAVGEPDGVAVLPLAGSLARQRLPAWQSAGARFSATPSAATAAERWLGQPVAVLTDAQLAVAAAGRDWNLLQFDLAPRHRGTRLLAQWGRQLAGPDWRVARWGLAALLVTQVVGLNLWAWHQQRAVEGKREAMNALLRTSHPQVRAVLDAPVQMKRETDTLREAAGVPGDADFEPLLAAAALAWPDGQPPAAQLRFEAGRLSLAAAGFGPPQIDQLRQRLRTAGWALDSADGRLTISRAAPAQAGS